MTDLSAYAPALDSVSVVPAGLTAHREGLYPLEPFTPDECAAVIDQIEAFNAALPERLFFASDEFYLKCGRPLPEDEYYGEYCQIENGVGMLTSFGVEFSSIFKTLDDDEKRVKREISVATGEAAYDFIRNLTEKLTAECPDLTVHVYPVKNNFFGGQVTVTGLLTGQDLLEQLSGRNLGEPLYLSRTTLRAEGDLFLCGMSPEELSEKLGVNIEFVSNDGSEFCLKLLGLE
jgi:NifB/MoaA-like Fe-S oxidoreductase